MVLTVDWLAVLPFIPPCSKGEGQARRKLLGGRSYGLCFLFLVFFYTSTALVIPSLLEDNERGAQTRGTTRCRIHIHIHIQFTSEHASSFPIAGKERGKDLSR
jgi:hypothetical protein